MDCSQEVSLIRERLADEAGISNLTFDVIRGKLRVEYDPSRIDGPRIVQAVGETGLRAERWQERSEAKPSFLRRNGEVVLMALSGAALAAGVTVQGFTTGSFFEALLAHNHAEGLTPAAVALFIGAILCGAYFVVPKALRSLAALRADMNVLMSISLIGASVLGEWAEAATLVFLFALATRIEGWSMNRVRREVGGLMENAPEQATLVHHDHEHRVPVEQVAAGSTVRVRPGERIPCDGRVTSGSSGVNEAMITGEAVPVWKHAGDEVFAGSFNGDGVLEILTSRVGAGTRLARILRMIEEGQHHRAPAEQFIDRFARYYTPAMIALAALVIVAPPLVAGGSWAHWFYQGMLVLLISCPCALVISTPVTIVAAMASGARRGVLIKGGAALEEAARIRTFAFDKTGVLTQGEPAVRSVVPLGGRSEEEVLGRLAGVEHYSEHPLARAIVAFAQQRGIERAAVDDFQSMQGRGAEAQVDGQRFWAGNIRLLQERGAETGEVRQKLAALEGVEGTVVVCGAGTEPWALVALEDPVRPEAALVIEELRRHGARRLVMLTGDNAQTAEAVARKVGIGDVRAEMLPEDKTAAVEGLLAQDGKAAMVGDGVNDAQAIAAASLGIGVGGRGTDVALETADAVLMSGSLRDLPFLIRHARRALAVVKQNVAIALALKAAFLVLAGFGAATLWMAVAADMGATMLVVSNGLRLLKAERLAPERQPRLTPVPEAG